MKLSVGEYKFSKTKRNVEAFYTFLLYGERWLKWKNVCEVIISSE